MQYPKKKASAEHDWASQDPLLAIIVPEEAMDTKQRAEKARTAKSPAESKQESEEKAIVEESISSMEVDVSVGVSESADTLKELVDHMEI